MCTLECIYDLVKIIYANIHVKVQIMQFLFSAYAIHLGCINAEHKWQVNTISIVHTKKYI